MNNIGERVVAALGEAAASELLDVLGRSDADRAALIGRLHSRDDARWLAQLLIDLEDAWGRSAGYDSPMNSDPRCPRKGCRSR
jgi:hypothetical protein